MTDRVSHDHPTVDTIPASIGRFGGTTRPEIRLQDPIAVDAGSVTRLVLGGSTYRARIVGTDEKPVVRGAYETPDLARNPGTGHNYLPDWIEDRDLTPGRTVHVDVVEEGFKYALRAPGETATYRMGRPDDTLADIAKQLTDR